MSDKYFSHLNTLPSIKYCNFAYACIIQLSIIYNSDIHNQTQYFYNLLCSCLMVCFDYAQGLVISLIKGEFQFKILADFFSYPMIIIYIIEFIFVLKKVPLVDTYFYEYLFLLAISLNTWFSLKIMKNITYFLLVFNIFICR